MQKWLDIVMVLMVLVMLLYQYRLTRPDIRNMITTADYVVIALIALLSFAFIKDVSEWLIYIKVMSGILMYFMGRLYYERIQESWGVLASAAYIIVYVNLIHRIFAFGGRLLTVTYADGDLYSNDTEMAYAMVLAFIFIGMFARRSVIKLITMALAIPYMVFFSDAGIQMILLAALAGVMLMYILEVALYKKKTAMLGLAAIFAILIIVVAVIYLPVVIPETHGVWKLFDNRILSSAQMDYRYADWQEVFAKRRPTGIFEKLLGLDLHTRPALQSLYLKIYYSIGIVGFVLIVLLIVRTFIAAYRGEDRKSFYVTVMTAILMLGSGVTVNSMEILQMSWFMMLFTGMVISAENAMMQESD